MKSYLSIITMLLFVFGAYAQNYKFGKVSEEEVKEQYYPLDSSAHAAILYKHESVYFDFISGEGWQQTKKVERRVKIYDKQGYDWATKEVYLYQGSSGNREKITKIKGYTYTIEDGKLQKTKLKDDGIFEEKFSEYRNKCTITMPNITEGAVIELSYEIISPFLDIEDLIFQYEIPVKNYDVSVAIPQYLRYNEYLNPKALYTPKILREEVKRSHMSTQKGQMSSDPKDARTTFSTSTTEYNDKVLNIREENIPAVKSEAFMGNVNNYKSFLTLELSAFVDYYGNVEQAFSSSWEDVSKSIYESRDFGEQLNKSNFFKEDIDAIVNQLNDPFQIAYTLHNFVKSKVKWNNYYGYSTMKGIRNAYKEGSGNIADINLLLIAMLRSNGVAANPVLISSRNHGIPLFPTRKGFNYVVCMVEKGEQYILLDASAPYSTLNMLPDRAINWKGRLIKRDGSSDWVNLNTNIHSVESSMLNVEVQEDFSANGKVRKSYTNRLAMKSRNLYNGVSESDLIKYLEDGKGDIEISNVALTNSYELNEPLQMSYDYQVSDAFDVVGEKVYFSPMLFMALQENPFKLDERSFPVEFVYPIEEKYMINIKLPEGYDVEFLPASEAFAFNEKDSEFQYIIKKNGAYLQLMVDFKINRPLVNPVDYPVFKSFFSKLVEKQGEQVVLTKRDI